MKKVLYLRIFSPLLLVFFTACGPDFKVDGKTEIREGHQVKLVDAKGVGFELVPGPTQVTFDGKKGDDYIIKIKNDGIGWKLAIPKKFVKGDIRKLHLKAEDIRQPVDISVFGKIETLRYETRVTRERCNRAGNPRPGPYEGWQTVERIYQVNLHSRDVLFDEPGASPEWLGIVRGIPFETYDLYRERPLTPCW